MYAHVKYTWEICICVWDREYVYEFMVKSIKASYIRMYSIRLQRY